MRRNFCCQKSRLAIGIDPWCGQPCQKQPSTNTATFSFGNTKSGFPKARDLLRHPVIPLVRNIVIRRSSVALLPAPFTRDMISERLRAEKTSVICFRRAASLKVPGGSQFRRHRYVGRLCFSFKFAKLLAISLAWRRMNVGGRAFPIISAIDSLLLFAGKRYRRGND